MRILLFAHLKDAAGRAELEWSGVGPLTADDFWKRLLAECPGLGVYRSQIRLARNWEYAAADELFHDGDEVALIPPVSGG